MPPAVLLLRLIRLRLCPWGEYKDALLVLMRRYMLSVKSLGMDFFFLLSSVRIYYIGSFIILGQVRHSPRGPCILPFAPSTCKIIFNFFHFQPRGSFESVLGRARLRRARCQSTGRRSSAASVGKSSGWVWAEGYKWCQ